MTACRGCQLIECVHNTRMQPPKCVLEEIELNKKGQCALFEIDYPYISGTSLEIRLARALVDELVFNEDKGYRAREPAQLEILCKICSCSPLITFKPQLGAN